MRKVKAKIKEVTIVSNVKFFGYESSSSGQTTGSDLAVKFEVPSDLDDDSLKAFMFEKKWELDHTLLEMEAARGSLTKKQFKKLCDQLETNYTALLDDFVDEDDDEDEDE